MKTQLLPVNFYRFTSDAPRIDETHPCTIIYSIGADVTDYDPYETNPRYKLTIHSIESSRELPAFSLPITGVLTDCGSGIIGVMVINLATNTVQARCATERFYRLMQQQIARKDELKAKWRTVFA